MEFDLIQLFKALIDEKASDLHITSFSSPRLRIQKKYIPIETQPLSEEEAKSLCLSVLNDLQKNILLKKKEICISFTVKNLARFKATIFYESGRIAGSFRAISSRTFPLDELALPSYLDEICLHPNGLVFINGRSGSGKSTTLSSILDHINTHRFDHIVTVEKPIEYLHTHKNCIVSQIEVETDVNSFEKAIENIHQKNPNILMVSEIPNENVLFKILTLAESGYLIFSSLPTPTIKSSFLKLCNFFKKEDRDIPLSLLANNLKAIICQELVPTLDGKQIVATEHLKMTPTLVPKILSEDFSYLDNFLIHGCEPNEGKSLSKSLYELISHNWISEEDAFRASSNPDDLKTLLSSKSTKAG